MITADSALALLALAIAAFALRGGGMMLGSLMPSTGKAGQFLRELPGTIMMSLAAPIVASGGPPEWIGAAVCGAVAWFTRSLLGTMAAGLATVWLLRQTLGS